MSQFLKCISISISKVSYKNKLDWIVLSINNSVKHKENARNSNPKVREFKINLKEFARNYTPNAKWSNYRREGKLHYKFQVGSNTCKRHAELITNIGSIVPFSNNINFEERYTEIYRSEYKSIKQDDSQLMHLIITDPQLADFHMITLILYILN